MNDKIKLVPPVIFIGPSGAGKSSVVGFLRELGVIELIPSWTTRPMRSLEEGRFGDHVFVTNAEFDSALEAGVFAATAKPFDLEFRYGLPEFRYMNFGKKIPALLLRAFLKEEIKTYSPDSLVYQIETPIDIARERLFEREPTGADLGSRLDRYDTELIIGREIASRIFVNDGDLHIVQEEVLSSLNSDFNFC